jgi:queuine tRNA-ribosyltransferase
MFTVKGEDGGARAGVLRTRHGNIKTPAFLPVATKGCVKTLDSEEVSATGAQGIIANAFLLYLKPGVEVIHRGGGLHGFMNWEKAIFTDSGGFQMLRKDFLLKVVRRGVTFISPFDKSKHLFTPEKCIEVQERLGSDIAMTLDDLPPFGSTYKRTAESVKRTIIWAERGLKTRDKTQLFAILQGGIYPDLREKCAKKLLEMGFHGYGIGGLSIGEPKETTYRILEDSIHLIPRVKPRYLMGVGSPMEMIRAVSMGVDLFDSAYPTRNARHSTAYTKRGKLNLSRGGYRKDFKPIDEGCGCPACRNHTRAYITHLLKVHETLGMRLVTLHNLHFTHDLLLRARDAINKGEFKEFLSEMWAVYG